MRDAGGFDPLAPTDLAITRASIENLLFSYAERIDAGDFAGVGALFARGRMLAPNGELIATGAEEVAALYERSTRLYEDGTPMTQHTTTNVIVELGEDLRTAEARARFTVMQALPDFPLQCIITGNYEDRFACDPEGREGERPAWYFTERCMKPRLLGDLSRHLKFDLPES